MARTGEKKSNAQEVQEAVKLLDDLAKAIFGKSRCSISPERALKMAFEDRTCLWRMGFNPGKVAQAAKMLRQ